MSIRNRVALVALALTLTGSIHAQDRRDGGGRLGGWPPYDTKQEATVTGKIVDTETIESPRDGSEFLIVNLTVDGKPFHIIAAPAAFIKKLGFAFPGGAEIKVIGFPGSVFRDDPAMIGGHIIVGGKTLDLRDAAGKPMWESRK